MSSRATPPSYVALHQQAHYDETYRSVDVDRLVGLVRGWLAEPDRLAEFLQDATSIHASWHGLYLDAFAERLRGARVLELGSGDGSNACVMAALGADVTASDVSSESGEIIRQVVERTGLTNLKFESPDATMRALAPRSLDYVVGKAFLHHLSHDEESDILADVANLLGDQGEARFFEPAVNSAWLDRARWMVPVPGRPSSLAGTAFQKWKDEDPHPPRDNSSDHYMNVGRRFFESAEAVPVGCLERFYRFLPRSRFQRSFRRWAYRAEARLPESLQRVAARAQLVVFRSPRRPG